LMKFLFNKIDYAPIANLQNELLLFGMRDYFFYSWLTIRCGDSCQCFFCAECDEVAHSLNILAGHIRISASDYEKVFLLFNVGLYFLFAFVIILFVVCVYFIDLRRMRCQSVQNKCTKIMNLVLTVSLVANLSVTFVRLVLPRLIYCLFFFVCFIVLFYFILFLFFRS
jgi:hypothetical protein